MITYEQVKVEDENNLFSFQEFLSGICYFSCYHLADYMSQCAFYDKVNISSGGKWQLNHLICSCSDKGSVNLKHLPHFQGYMNPRYWTNFIEISLSLLVAVATLSYP